MSATCCAVDEITPAEREDQRDLGPRFAESLGDIGDQKRQDEEVEGIEGPAQEARQDLVALIAPLHADGSTG